MRVDADSDIRSWMRNVDRFDGFIMSRQSINEQMPQLLKRNPHPVIVPRRSEDADPRLNGVQFSRKSLELDSSLVLKIVTNMTYFGLIDGPRLL